MNSRPLSYEECLLAAALSRGITANLREEAGKHLAQSAHSLSMARMFLDMGLTLMSVVHASQSVVSARYARSYYTQAGFQHMADEAHDLEEIARAFLDGLPVVRDQ